MKRLDPFMIIMIALLAANSIGNNRYDSVFDWIMNMIVMLPALVVGLSMHEYAHAKTAYKLGDMTPKFQNRVTINPLSHMDPLGFISLMLVGFGWGVPVQINPSNFKNPRRDELLVSIAGVTMNFIIAFISCGIYIFMINQGGKPSLSTGVFDVFTYVVLYLVHINVVLMIFNLMPIPPLDGFNILTQVFNLRKYEWYYTLYRNGFLILLAFILFGVTDIFLSRGINAIIILIEKLWMIII